MLLVPIALYKYAPPVTDLVRSTGWAAAPTVDLALPLGISFFTFHAISYVVDVGRGGLPPERSLRDYLLYLFLFPHQIAGPIVRYSEIVKELKDRRDVTLGNATYGLTRFAWGLAKKAYIADSAGVVADAAFSAPDSTMNAATAWVGAWPTPCRSISTSAAIRTWPSGWPPCSDSDSRRTSERPIVRSARPISGAAGT